MSFFSDLLGKLIATKGVKSNALAQYCGIERSFMYKIIKGTRHASNMDTVLMMAEYLRLTPSEKTDFIEAYKISIEGLENYYRRKNILELFENFRKYSGSFSALTHKAQPHPALTGNVLCFNGQTEINHMLLQILFLESQRQTPEINLVIQPDFHFLMNLLCTLGCENKNLSIRHIICFNSSDQVTIDKKNYNLTCLKNILPVFSCACRYDVHYYYGNMILASEDLSLFPYLVLTSEYAFLLSKELHSGILFQGENNLNFFNNLYTQYLEKTSSFGVTMSDLTTQLNYFHHLKTDKDQNYCLQMLPCLTYCLPDYFFEKYIYPDIPNREYLISLLLGYVHDIRNRFTEYPIRFIFSLEGLQRFLDTGRIPEYPPEVYAPFEPADRIVLIRRFLDMCSHDSIRMLKCSIGDLDNELFMYVNQQNGYLMFPSSTPDLLICLDITEPGLLHGFCDFCEHLDQDLFYTEDEAVSVISSLIDEKKER